MNQSRVTNVVATAQLDREVSYVRLLTLQNSYNLVYAPQRFSGIVLRAQVPLSKSHCRVYSNGKMTINGGQSVAASRALAEMYCDIIRSCDGGYYDDIALQSFKVVNIVANINFNKALDLVALTKQLPKSLYEPERFPGLSVKLSDATCVLFYSGKCNILGAKEELDIAAALLELDILAGLHAAVG